MHALGQWGQRDAHIIHLTLHWAKAAMVKVRYVYCLIDNKVIHLLRVWNIVGNGSTHGSVGLSAKGWVIAID